MRQGEYFFGWRVYAVLGAAFCVFLVFPWGWAESTSFGRLIVDVASDIFRPIWHAKESGLDKVIPGIRLMMAVTFTFSIPFVVFSMFKVRPIEYKDNVKTYRKVLGFFGFSIFFSFAVSMFIYGDSYHGELSDSYYENVFMAGGLWWGGAWLASISLNIMLAVIITPLSKFNKRK